MDRRKLLKLTTALAPLAWLLGKPSVVSTEETPPTPSKEYNKGWNDALKHHRPYTSCKTCSLANTTCKHTNCTHHDPEVSTVETNPCKEIQLPAYLLCGCTKEECTKEECNGCRDWYDGPTQCRWITPTGDPANPDYSSNSAARTIVTLGLGPQSERQAPNCDRICRNCSFNNTCLWCRPLQQRPPADCDGCCEDCHGCQDT